MLRFSPICLTVSGAVFLSCGISTAVQAQSVQADGSAIGTLVSPSSQTFTITGGRQLQQNLFHSFSQFSIPSGGNAIFDLSGNTGVSTIFSRVTGNSISNINGLIQTVNSSNPVSLFLMNPNGIIFGPNARLDIGGSFVGTTASGIQFENGTVFNSGMTGDSALLTVSTPIGLQFGKNSGAIVIQNIGHQLAPNDPIGITPAFGPAVPGLDAKPGQSIALIGGNLQFQGGIVNAKKITLGSVAGEGIVSIQNTTAGLSFGFDPSQALGDISMVDRSLATVSGLTAGTIDLVSKTLTIKDGSLLFAQQFGPFSGGAINLNVKDQIDIIGVSSDGKTRTGLITESLGSGTGAMMSIKTSQLNLYEGGAIGGRAAGAGAAGDIDIQADGILVDGFYRFNPLVGSAIASASLGSGTSSRIQIKAKQALFRSSGAISSTSFGSGRSGNLDLDIEDLQVIGTNPIGFQSGVGSISYKGGVSGNLKLRSRTISLENGGNITTSALGSGSAGDLEIIATERIYVTSKLGSGIGATGISSSATKASPFLRTLLGLDASPSGNAGTVTIQTPKLMLADRATVSVSNQGSGSGGKIIVNAGTIALSNEATITSSTVNGSGGNIKLTSQQLLLRDRSRIESESIKDGDGGNITLNNDLIVGLENSDIIANASQGRGGNIQINTNAIFGLQYRDRLTPGNDITASSEFGLNGNVIINNLSVTPQTQMPSLESDLRDKSTVSDRCGSSKAGQFIITGRGGIPKAPSKNSGSQRVWQDLRVPLLTAKSVDLPIVIQSRDTIFEASQSHRNEDGTIALIGSESSHLTSGATCATPNQL